MSNTTAMTIAGLWFLLGALISGIVATEISDARVRRARDRAYADADAHYRAMMRHPSARR
jgi:hypothetical protein